MSKLGTFIAMLIGAMFGSMLGELIYRWVSH